MDTKRIKPRRYDLNPSDFLAAVSGEMTPAELGVYWMICLLQYERRGPVPNDMAWLRRRFKATHGLSIIDKIVRNLIASGRVESDGAALSVQRVSEEIANAQRRMEDRVNGATAPGRVSSKNNGLEPASTTKNHTPTYGPVRDPTEIWDEMEKKRKKTTP